MPNPINQTNTTVPIKTYNILKQIKEKQNCTFDEVLEQLIELELKNNYVTKTIDYELVYNGEVFQFQINFKKDSFIIKYLIDDKFTTRINDWGLDKRITSIFYEFINENCARCIFLNMPFGLIFEEFDIYKINSKY
ncbi:MAG: hypothetical protein IJH12_01965 [Clostridia bacterium]|nr:hypothetical protein [Clostridia bacterium]